MEEHLRNGRRAIRRVISSCVICKRHNAKRVEVSPAALPEDRVRGGRVFETGGIDLAGPLFIKKGKKAWIVVFTCTVYRCVHLEIVKYLSTDDFLEVFQRFMWRRGRPTVVYSDNGTNFVGLVNLWKDLDWERITREWGLHRIQWKLIPPTATWWERLVRSIKYVLKRVLGKSSLTFDKLRNVVCEIEAYINGRPLTLCNEDPEDFIPLTPATFMHEMPVPGVSDLSLLEASGFRKLNRERVKVLEELKSRFRREYLSQLVQRGKAIEGCRLMVGDIVLVGAYNKKRWAWPLARIVELIPGKDGNVRVARVKTVTGEWIRPLQRLYPLEVSSPNEIPQLPEDRIMVNEPDEQEQRGNEKPVITTRSGRKVVQPVRYQRMKVVKLLELVFIS
jgi:hypothetical protein